MKARTLGVAMLLLASACGGRVDETTEPNFDVPSTLFHSGTRLKARVLRADSAPPYLSAIVDSEVHRECSFHRAGDGELRCLPSPQVGVFAYADADCEEPLVSSAALFALASCENDLLATVTRMQSAYCDAEPVSVFELEPVDEGAQLYRKLEGGCEAVPKSNGTQLFGLYRLAREVEPGRFVRAEVVEAPLSPRLTQRTLDAEDGSSWQWNLHDDEMKTDCWPGEIRESDLPSASDSPIACLPTSQSGTQWVSRMSDCSDDGSYVTALDRTCYDLGQAPSQYMRVADGWARVSQEPTTEQLFGYSCEPLSELALFEPQELVENSDWLPLERAELGTGRLRSKAVTYDGRVLATSGLSFDSKRNASCAPYSTSAGFRCIADGLSRDGLGGETQSLIGASLRYYADSAQQEQLASYTFAPPPAFQLAKARDSRSCADLSGPFAGLFIRGNFLEAAYPVGQKYTGPLFDETGEPVDREKVSELTFYRLGAAVPWSKFPALYEFIE